MKTINLKLGTLLVAAAALFGCTQDPAENAQPNAGNDAIERKILFAWTEAPGGELLVKLSDQTVAAIEQNIAPSNATRSGVEPFDAVLTDIGAVSLERVFPYDKRNEEEARAYGLHRWYTVRFDSQVSLDEAAHKLAGLDDIAYVQYNPHVEPMFDGKFVPVAATGAYDRIETRTTMSGFNDPELKSQWHYNNTGDETLVKPIAAGCDINLEAAWELCTGDPSIIVAVTDQPVDPAHEDIADNMWINTKELNGSEGVDDDGNGYKDDIHGYNFVNNTNTFIYGGEAASHGMHVAGTISAVNNNGKGVCGIAGGNGNKNGVKIMTLQIFGPAGSATTAQVAAAIKYAADNGASIIQCSWGLGKTGPSTDQAYLAICGAEAEAFHYFITKPRSGSPLNGGIAIVAGGNDTMDCDYPAAYPEMVCVTSVSTDFTPSTFTNFSAAADIAAPGGDLNYHNDRSDKGGILSTLLPPTNYGYMSGTSMACPHVSGVAALALSYAKQLGKTFQPEEFRSMLLASVRDLDSHFTGTKKFRPYSTLSGIMELENYRGKMGSGLVDAYKLLLAVRGIPAIMVAPNEPTTITLSEYYSDLDKLKYLFEIDNETVQKLGLTESDDNNGKITITCTKQGAGIARIRSSVGGTSMSREVAIICRAKAAANGGWM
ncbi:MAG: S8 family serine peptidase [Alistipes sp.]|nr:S8 family serine peptidase [Alistipes sp.]